MRCFVRRLAVIGSGAPALVAFAAVVAPAVSSAQCDNGWWDPVANVCRPPVVVPPPLACDNGWWWDPVANVCRQPVVPPPLACDNAWWWDPVANVCRPVLPPA